MNNLYILDGVDMYDAFGFIASEGSDDFLKLPTRKTPPTFDWPEDKTEYDLSEPAFHGQEAALTGCIKATSEADFHSKWNSLKTMLTAPGKRVIEVVEIGESYDVFYLSQPVSKRLTRIKGATQISYQISISFQVMDFSEGFEPGGNGGFVNIKNQDAEVIAVVQAPGEYQVIELSGIQDDGSGAYTNSIVDNL